MKSKILLIASMGVFACLGALAQDAFYNLDFDVQKSNISMVDMDGDGDRDILIIGQNPDGLFSQLFQNNGEMAFEKVESPFAPTFITSVDYGDINGDGLLDVIQSGFADSVIVNLYTSDVEGVISLNNYSNELLHIAPSSGIADLNNDGYADMYVFGNHDIGEEGGKRAKIYFGDGKGGFTEESLFDEYEFIDPNVVEVDFDNDGDLDLWVMAGYEVSIDARFARLFVNDGNGAFTETDLDIIAKGPGSSDWGDYDSDGDLDLLIGGWGFVNSGEDNDMIYRIYENKDGVLAEATTFQPYGHFSPASASTFADWDNDGDLDVIVTGWNPDANRQATAIFFNNAGTFTEYEGNASLPGVSESSVEIGDLDNDGDLDLVIGGYSGNNFNGEGSAFNRNVSLVIENTTAGTNEAPSAPANLVATAAGNNVTFTWDEATDDKTASQSLTYNLFLVNAEGQFFYYPLADTASGYLTVQEKGNMQLNNKWTVKGLPYGEYRWGVQAIDNSFAGSTFATSTFTHSEGGPLSAFTKEGAPLIYPNPVSGPISVHTTRDLLSFSLTALDGRLVEEHAIKGRASTVQLDLDAGIYLLRAIYADGRVTTDKIVVQ